MAEKQYKVYVIQGRSERDDADCRAALARVPARLETLPCKGVEYVATERSRHCWSL